MGRILWLGSSAGLHVVDPRGCHLQAYQNPWEFSVSEDMLPSAARRGGDESDRVTRRLSNTGRDGNSLENPDFIGCVSKRVVLSCFNFRKSTCGIVCMVCTNNSIRGFFFKILIILRRILS